MIFLSLFFFFLPPSDDSFIDSFLMLTGDDDGVEGGATSEAANKKIKLNNSLAESNTLVDKPDNIDIGKNEEDGTEAGNGSDNSEDQPGETEN